MSITLLAGHHLKCNRAIVNMPIVSHWNDKASQIIHYTCIHVFWDIIATAAVPWLREEVYVKEGLARKW